MRYGTSPPGHPRPGGGLGFGHGACKGNPEEESLCLLAQEVPMTPTSLSTFDKTVHQANLWLKEIQEELRWGDRQQAYHALRAVLHALRDRLPLIEVSDFAAQLPMVVRGMYYEGWHPRADGTPRGERGAQAFLDQVARGFAVAPEHVDPALLTGAVFRVLARRVSGGEVEDVLGAMPQEIRRLWPRALAMH